MVDELKPRGLGAGGSLPYGTSGQINANVEVRPLDKADAQRVLDFLDQLLKPQKSSDARVGIVDRGRRDSILPESGTKTSSAGDFKTMLEQTIEREKVYLVGDQPAKLDANGRRIHGARISGFLHEARERAESLFGSDPIAHGAALHALGQKITGLFLELHSGAKEIFRYQGSSQLAQLSDAQREAWLTPPGGRKYETIGLRKGGLGDDTRLGIEIRSFGPERRELVFDDLATVALMIGRKGSAT